MTGSIDEFDVILNMRVDSANSPNGLPKKLTFTLFDVTENRPTGKTAVGKKKKDNTATLIVAKNEDRIIRVKLSDDWDWTFDKNNPLQVSEGQSKHYAVQDVTEKVLTIHCKPSGYNPTAGQDDKLDFVVHLAQKEGRDVKVIIDPVTENPPPEIGPGGDPESNGTTPNSIPLPIA